MTEILRVENLSKNFGEKNILCGVNFSVNVGECLGVVGKSGCGKSTLAKIIMRLTDFDGGKIFFCGEDTKNFSDKKFYKNVQMIFQTPDDSFDPRKTLGWSIAEPIKNFGEKNNLDEQIKNLLAEVGLTEEIKNRYPREVSGGQCQRAAIARAISISPKLLICDEITSALDVTVQKKIIELIKNLCLEKNIAVIFITHDLAILPQLADKIIVMNGGKIVEEGTPKNILKSPQSEFTRELIEKNFFMREKI